VLKIRINEEHGTTNQGARKVVFSIIKAKDFYVKLEISLEDKVYLKTYHHHSQANIEVDETRTKIQV
jgi:hypothetical protein